MCIIPDFFGDLGDFSPKKEKNLGEQKFAYLLASNFCGRIQWFQLSNRSVKSTHLYWKLTVVKTTLVKCLQLLWPPISNTKAKFANCNEFHFSAKREIYKIAWCSSSIHLSNDLASQKEW
jgi:hypothetical protein